MTPAARSSEPATALNFTSTKPSRMLVSLLMASGNVARPDCLRTFGLLGAVGSASTLHFGSPLPVIVKVHPSGDVPVAALSKFKVSATAFPPSNKTSIDARTALAQAQDRDGKLAGVQIIAFVLHRRSGDRVHMKLAALHLQSSLIGQWS